MKSTSSRQFSFSLAAAAGFVATGAFSAESAPRVDGKFLYVTVSGVRDDLKYGGHAFLVFDIEL